MVAAQSLPARFGLADTAMSRQSNTWYKQNSNFKYVQENNVFCHQSCSGAAEDHHYPVVPRIRDKSRKYLPICEIQDGKISGITRSHFDSIEK